MDQAVRPPQARLSHHRGTLHYGKEGLEGGGESGEAAPHPPPQDPDQDSERVFLLQATSPLRVTALLTNKHREKNPTQNQQAELEEGEEGAGEGEADARLGPQQMGPDES
ncbi:hypothetical protein Q5P01_004547 [Channa striata]|uniref:Uncharacterized protein n=1 Tax=Channa striata TaxID=64152 RepID=A0AA88NBZ0_CHASR|nr:hypothetical protein Q5P01_004547 [Channa striata]